jgi:ribose transport system substrate-binding protein
LTRDSLSRRSWLRASGLAVPSLVELASCQPPVRQKLGLTVSPGWDGVKKLQGVEAILEGLPPRLPKRAPEDWRWMTNPSATVGLLMISSAAPYLAGYRKAFDAECRRLNLTVIALDANNDPATQASQAEDLVAKRVDVLCFWPVDARAIVPSVRNAFERGIPLVCTNSWPEPSVVDCFHSFIGASMVEEGMMAAQIMAEALNKRGKVAIIEGNPGQDATYWRSTAFLDELHRIAPEIQVLDKQTARWDRARAIAVAENFLTSYPDLNGIMAQTDDMAIGAMHAVESAGRQGKISIVSIDASREGLQAVRDAKLFGTCTQSPSFEGIYTARVARDVVNGWPPPPRWIRNPVVRVDKSNVGEVFGDW